MTDGFVARGDLRTYFAELNRRLRTDPFVSDGEPRRAKRTVGLKQSFWGRLGSLSNSFRQLTATRRRVDDLEAELSDLRSHIAAFKDYEVRSFEAVVTSVTTALDQHATSVGTALDQFGSRSDRAVERLGATVEQHELKSDKHRADLAAKLLTLQNAVRNERDIRQQALGRLERGLETMRHLGPALHGAALGAERSDVSLGSPVSTEALLKSFYFTLEERYRGSREEIKGRLSVYARDLQAAHARIRQPGMILDLGCGRGELLELARELGLEALGVDSNPIQLEAARRESLNVVEADALSFLQTLKDKSVAAVVAIHVIEHLPFAILLRFVQEISRVVQNGGLVIFETPNPRNLIVGAHTFNLDPTHVRPIPSEVAEILLDVNGFADVTVRPLHPSGTREYMVQVENVNPHIADLLFGPQDYAILASRPL